MKYLTKFILAILLCIAAPANAQIVRIPVGASLPSTCTVGDTFLKTGASAGLYVCTSTNTFTIEGSAGTGTVTSVALTAPTQFSITGS